MNQSSIQVSIKAAITGAVGLLPVKYDDDTRFKNNAQPYAQVLIRGNGSVTEFCEYRIGIIVVRIYMPKNIGINRATLEAEKFTNLFSKSSIHGGVGIIDHGEEIEYSAGLTNWDVLSYSIEYKAML